MILYNLKTVVHFSRCGTGHLASISHIDRMWLLQKRQHWLSCLPLV